MPAFGFGIGDFIAVGTLATQIIKALSTNGGAAASYSSLIRLLQSVYVLVGEITSYLSSSPLAVQMRIDPTTLNALRHHLECCQLLMTQFLVHAKPFTESILNGNPKSFKAQLRKIQWNLTREDDARRLEQRIQTQLEAAQIYLGLIIGKSQLEASHSQIETAVRTESKVDIVNSKLDGMIICWQTVEQRMPHDMGYPWETEMPIFFEDVFGRCHRLPQILCRDVRTFCDTLRLLFRAMVDHDGIGRWENYELVEESTTLPLFSRRNVEAEDQVVPRTWHETVQPGKKLAMNIIRTQKIAAKTDALIPLVPKNRNCPKCDTICYGTKFSRCGSCRYTFGISVEESQDYNDDFFNRQTDLQTWSDKAFSRSADSRVNGNLLPTTEPPIDSLAHQIVQASFDYSNPVSAKPKEEEHAFMRVRYITRYVVPDRRNTQDERDSVSRNPLSHAVARCDVNWARQVLCSTGADPNARDGDFLTPLARICRDPKGDFGAMIRLLIKHGADVNRRYPNPLCIATERGDIALVNLLISLGANVNASYWGPLRIACGEGNAEMVKIFLAAGAHVNPNGGDTTPLQASCRGGHLEVVKTLLAEGANVDFDEGKGEGTALQRACQGGHVEVVMALLAAGANVNLGPEFEHFGHSGPLRIACESGDTDLATLLIEAGADLNPDIGRLPLPAACANRHIDIIRKLIAGGADVNASDIWNGTSLRAASANGRLDVVKMLLAVGANVNANTEDQETVERFDHCPTAVLAACKAQDIAIVKLLIEAGAHLNSRAATGATKTTLVAAIGGRRPWWDETLRREAEEKAISLVKYFIEQGADVNGPSFQMTALGAAAATRQTRVLEELLALGADVNQTSTDGVTALYHATPHAETMKLLLDHGADVNAISKGRYDNSRATALHKAASSRSVEAVRLLVDSYGALVNLPRNGNSDTALERSISDYRHRESESDAKAQAEAEAVATFLLQRSAECTSRALHRAAKVGYVNIVKLLLEYGNKVYSEDCIVKALEDAVRFEKHEVIANLLERSTKPTPTCAHLAVYRGNMNTLKMLLMHGAPIDKPAATVYGIEHQTTKDWFGWTGNTVLETALYHNRPRIVQILQEWEQDPEAARAAWSVPDPAPVAPRVQEIE